MDLATAIGLLSSFVTLEEAGRSWVLLIKDKLKRKEIDINNSWILGNVTRIPRHELPQTLDFSDFLPLFT